MQSENILGGYWIHIGPVPISGTVITTWCTMLAIFLFAFLSTRRLRLKPSTYQAMIEGVVEIMESAIAATDRFAMDIYPGREPGRVDSRCALADPRPLHHGGPRDHRILCIALVWHSKPGAQEIFQPLSQT